MDDDYDSNNDDDYDSNNDDNYDSNNDDEIDIKFHNLKDLDKQFFGKINLHSNIFAQRNSFMFTNGYVHDENTLTLFPEPNTTNMLFKPTASINIVNNEKTCDIFYHDDDKKIFEILSENLKSFVSDKFINVIGEIIKKNYVKKENKLKIYKYTIDFGKEDNQHNHDNITKSRIINPINVKKNLLKLKTKIHQEKDSNYIFSETKSFETLDEVAKYSHEANSKVEIKFFLNCIKINFTIIGTQTKSTEIYSINIKSIEPSFKLLTFLIN
jgi:hypothetical protein